jgi:hypothetical protein
MTVHARTTAAQDEVSPAQQRFWLLQHLSGRDGNAFNVCVCVRLDGALELDSLTAALRAVIARHHVLRTCYPRNQGVVVAAPVPLEAIAPVEIGSRVRAEYDGSSATALARELAERPFDLRCGPLLRVRVIANGPRQSYLVVVVHHIIWDGWSTTILLGELRTAYEAGAHALPALPARYADYAAQRRVLVDTAAADREIAYWRERLEGFPHLAPLTQEDPADGELPVIHRLHVELGDALCEQIASCARVHGVTPFSVIVAGLQLLFWRVGLGADSALAVPLADRTERRFEPLIGCFLNTVLLRGTVTASQSFAELLHAARENSFGALAHSSVPFEQVIRRAIGTEDRRRAQRFQAVVAFQSYPQQDHAIGRAAVSELPVYPARGRIAATFTVWLDAPRPSLDLEWNGALPTPPQELAARWRELLVAGMRDPAAPLDTLAPGAPVVARRRCDERCAGDRATVRR